MTNQAHTHAFLSALAGIDTVYDFRAYHDQRRDLPSRVWRGRIMDHLAAMEAAQADGFGIHVVMNETDGVGLKRANVVRCRAQLLDLDGVDAAQRMAQVLAGPVAPHMIVRTSPGKAQLWFKVTPHDDLGLHEDNQVRLLRAYGGDDQVVGAERTARLPGFYHLKAEPSLVTVEAGPLWTGGVHDARGIAGALWNISVERAAHADRQALGHGPWQAPSLDALRAALFMMSPNMGRDEWIGITAAFKQAGWSFGEAVIRPIWDEWCGQYTLSKGNDFRENTKQWQAIGDATSSGWPKLERESGYRAARMFGAGVPAVVDGSVGVPLPGDSAEDEADVRPTKGKKSGDMFMFPNEQEAYFKNCFSIVDIGKIMGPDGRMMNQTQFNIAFGGQSFILDQMSKVVSDDAWKAATRGRVFKVPVVDHIRFWPQKPFGYIGTDARGRKGVNTYSAPEYIGKPGDITPFLNHLQVLLPEERDRSILMAFMAQCIQRPGTKIKWAIVIQSVEGVGKTLFQRIMEAGLGETYVHSPAAKELTDSGGRFNGWMREKLMIIINEIKSDEKRELVEVMKPWITDERIEMTNKGQDQNMADNPTNWLMFTNHKDAIPVSKNGRRYAVMYSALQEKEDKDAAGIDRTYMSRLYDWAKKGGLAHIVDYLMHYEIPAEFDAESECTEAPTTSSTAEAIEVSRGWLEQMILEAIEGDRPGFRGGWISTVMVTKMLEENHMRSVTRPAMSNAIKSLGYKRIGQATRAFLQEMSASQSVLYCLNPKAKATDYPVAQRYENAPPAPTTGTVIPIRA